MAENGYIPNSDHLRSNFPHSYRENGILIPFDEQLQNLDQYFDKEFLLLAEHSKSLGIVYGSSKPLVLAKKKIDLIRKHHPEVVRLLPYLPELIQNSPMAIESRKRKNSLVFVLNPAVPTKSSIHNAPNLIPILPIHFDEKAGLFQVDKIASVFEKKQFNEFITISFVAGKKIYINENFAKWEGLLPHRSRPSPYPLRQIYFSLGLSNNQEKLQLVPVFDDNPSNQWRETKSQITAPEGFRWLTNESEIVLEVVNESLKLDDEPLYYEILQRSTNRQLLNSARQPNLPPKAIEFLAQHKNRSVRDTLAQNPTISSDVLKVYSLKKLQKDDVMNRSKDGKRVRASMAKQQKRQGQQQRKNRGPKR